MESHPLKQHRIKNHLSLEALGAVLGTHKTTILRWERGHVKIPAERAVKISLKTGIPKETLRPDLFSHALRVVE